MEKYATSKILDNLLECHIKILLLKIAKLKDLDEQETTDFIEEYLGKNSESFCNLEWVRKESLETDQAFDIIGESLFNL